MFIGGGDARGRFVEQKTCGSSAKAEATSSSFFSPCESEAATVLSRWLNPNISATSRTRCLICTSPRAARPDANVFLPGDNRRAYRFRHG